MGIDLDKGGRGKNKSFKQTKTTDVYLKLLIKVIIFYLKTNKKLFTFLARRTNSKFNKVILKRLNKSRI